MSDNGDFRVPPDLTAQPFICPNCRSTKCRGQAFVDPGWTFGIGNPSESPWDFVFQLRFCGECGATIPAHLAERWEGMTWRRQRKSGSAYIGTNPTILNLQGW